MEASKDELFDLLQSLGLGNKRSRLIQSFTKAYLNKKVHRFHSCWTLIYSGKIHLNSLDSVLMQPTPISYFAKFGPKQYYMRQDFIGSMENNPSKGQRLETLCAMA